MRTPLQLDFHRPLWGVDACPDVLALVPRDVAVAQVPDLARDQLPDAGVADALAAAVGQVEPGLLAGDEDRSRAVGLGLAVGLGELDRPALALLDVRVELGLEALHVEA